MSIKIVIINYGMGNLRSVINAFNYHGISAKISNDKDEISNADGIVFPGVGGYQQAVQNLKELNICDLLRKVVLDDGKPCMGICLGMQLFFENSSEGAGSDGLGWIKGTVRKLEISNGDRLPHVGWNNIEITKDAAILDSVDPDRHYYFDHSYGVICDENIVHAKTSYGGQKIVALVNHDNIWGTQFHPEKSQAEGVLLYKNFADIVINSLKKC
jgi:imidazole glycerol-phosphate synthase subunit HisH